MSKHDRIREFAESLRAQAAADPSLAGLDPRYAGWFICFNRGGFYEAHDVLEDLWLEEKGPFRLYYQALIQLAGAFVHMKHQLNAPHHPKHARRLRPAARLLALAGRNLRHYEPRCLGLDVTALRQWISSLHAGIEQSGHTSNPLSRGPLPVIRPRAATPSESASD